MLQKMGSQMEELLTASKPAAKPARPPTVEGGATPPRMREAESSGSENSDEEVRERRRSPPRRRSLSLDRASGHRSLSPQRPLSEPPPTAPSVGVSNASEPVIDQIGSLALLLEPSGLDGPPPLPLIPNPSDQSSSGQHHYHSHGCLDMFRFLDFLGCVCAAAIRELQRLQEMHGPPALVPLQEEGSRDRELREAAEAAAETAGETAGDSAAVVPKVQQQEEAVSRLRGEVEGCKLSVLRKRAKALGVDERKLVRTTPLTPSCPSLVGF